jgi:hypothetical protein
MTAGPLAREMKPHLRSTVPRDEVPLEVARAEEKGVLTCSLEIIRFVSLFQRFVTAVGYEMLRRVKIRFGPMKPLYSL